MRRLVPVFLIVALVLTILAIVPTTIFAPHPVPLIPVALIFVILAVFALAG